MKTSDSNAIDLSTYFDQYPVDYWSKYLFHGDFLMKISLSRPPFRQSQNSKNDW